jgi:OOP family OmpA-OmpF porin
MVNKKYILLAGLCAAMAAPAFAQETKQASSWSGRDMTYRGQVYDVLDTAYVPKGRMEQQRQYLNHQYAFPAKPRNMWEIGVSAGFQNIFGDVTSKMPWSASSPLNALGFGASIRKAMGYTFSWRLAYNFQNAQGIDYRPRTAGTATAYNNPWGARYPAGETVYSNYKYRGHELTLQLVAASNNIRFHKAKNAVSFYGFAGAGALLWNTQVGVANSANANWNYAAWQDADGTLTKEGQKEYRKELKDATYVDYSREYLTNKGRANIEIGDKSWGLVPALVGGAGIQFKLGDRVTLQFEDKLTWTGLDILDATEAPMLLNNDKDIMNYASVGLGFNIGKKSKNVQPLWWVNPMDHIYSEVAAPRHMMLPDPVLADDDGDGIANQFDKCPDTQAGIKVDASGCPLDTDGDGVPDYMDKEPITPTYCQPVDADGVGKCPCPEGCGAVATACGNIASGAITFSGSATALSAAAQSQLANLAAQMSANPECKVVVMGNAGSSKVQQQRAWDRVNKVITYMTETQNISRDRFIFQYSGATGDVNSVMYRSANDGETGPSSQAPPFPHLQSNK